MNSLSIYVSISTFYLPPTVPTFSSKSHENLDEELDLAFYNVKPKDWYFVLIRFKLGQNWGVSCRLDGSRASFVVPGYSPSKSLG